MLFSVAGRAILVKAHDDWSSEAVSQIFAGWFIHSLPDQPGLIPDATVAIHCGVSPPAPPDGLTSFDITNDGTCFTDHKTYYARFGESLVIFGPGSTDEVNLWVDQQYDFASTVTVQLLSHALSPALRRCGVFEIHSGAVIPVGHEDAIMIAGPSGSGKSTLTSKLAQCGWGYVSDDIVLLRDIEQRLEISAFRRFFALTGKTIAAAGLPQKQSSSSVLAKVRVQPEEHFEHAPVERATPASILFPTITHDERTRIVSLTSAEAMSRLLRLCPWSSFDHPTSKEHLRMLGKLANTTNAFDLFAGQDVLEHPHRAAEAIYDSIGAAALIH